MRTVSGREGLGTVRSALMKSICCLLFVLFAAIPFSRANEDPCSIQIFVGKEKSVTITFPCMARADLIEVLSTFFGKQDESAKKRAEAVLDKSSEVTLVLTTRR